MDFFAISQKSKVDDLAKSGIPINALPGWEDVPLCDKLPMLKCPNNQIIFSRNKIGRKLWKAAEYVLYDPNCYTKQIDYNSLHDPHLKHYFSKESNLKRLREIGKLTENNDVICDLKDFNSYRQYLRRLHIDLINQERLQKENYQVDKIMVRHAENITQADQLKYQNSANLTLDRILHVKSKREREKHLGFVKNLQKFEKTVKSFEKMKKLKMIQLAQKTQVHNLIIRKRRKLAFDMEKKRIINLKKRLKIRDTRSKKHRKYRLQLEFENAQSLAINSWKKRLEWRQKRHTQIIKLKRQYEKQKLKNIEKRKTILQRQWKKIEAGIFQKSRSKNRKFNRKKLAKKLKRAIRNDEVKEYFSLNYSPNKFKKTEEILPNELNDVLETALAFENISLYDGEQFSLRIIKSAKYIFEEILKKIQRDLSQDEIALENLQNRVKMMIEKIKHRVITKFTKMFSNLNSIQHSSSESSKSTVNSLSKSVINSLTKSGVSFAQIHVIEASSQKMYSPMKTVRYRTPTPASSLSSIEAIVKEIHKQDINQSLNQISYIKDIHERIFMEHYFIKFSRLALIGVGKRVFGAIEHLKKKLRLEIRPEILDYDKEYLIKIMSQSILSYHLNEYNFHGNLRLLINVISTEIINELQITILKPKKDSKYHIKAWCRSCTNRNGIRNQI